MSELERDYVSAIANLVLAEARKRANDARMSGYMHDGGASVLETQVAYFMHGFSGRIPHAWAKHEKELVRATDPEWAEYERLRRKFE